MKRLVVLALALVATVAALAAIPAFGATKSVTVGDNFFKPTSITVKSGTTVKWKWTGSAPHNVTVTKGPKRFHSKTITSGSYSRRLFTKGTYRIVCTIHQPGMKMTVKVR